MSTQISTTERHTHMETPIADALDRQVDAEVADTTLQVSKTAALNHASLVLIEAESAVDVMVSDSKIRIAQTWLSYVANLDD